MKQKKFEQLTGKASNAKASKVATSKTRSVEEKYKSGEKLTDDDLMSWAIENNYEGFDISKNPKMTAKHRKEITNYIHGATSGNAYYGNGKWENDTLAKASKSKAKHWSENVGHDNEGWTPEQQAIINYEEEHAGYPEFDKSHFGRASHKIDWMTKDSYESLEPKDWKSLHAAMLKDQKSKGKRL